MNLRMQSTPGTGCTKIGLTGDLVLRGAFILTSGVTSAPDVGVGYTSWTKVSLKYDRLTTMDGDRGRGVYGGRREGRRRDIQGAEAGRNS